MSLYKNSTESCAADVCSVNCLSINGRQSQVQLYCRSATCVDI